MEKMINFFKKIFGWRTLKTALATGLAIYLAELLNVDMPLMAGISVVVSMTSSIFDSYKISVNRMLSTIIGALLASLFQLIGLNSIFTMMIGIVIIINICNFFNWKKSIVLSVIVFVIIFLYEPRLSTDPTYYMYSLFRVRDTALGLIIGFLVNYFIAPPNRPKFLLTTYKKSLKEFEDSFQLLLAGAKNIKIENLIDDINEINTELKSIKNDRKLFKNRNIKLSTITNINYDFFSAFGLIAQLADNETIPNIYDENMEEIKNYFSDTLVIISTCQDKEYELAFNYFLSDLLKTMFKLRESIIIFENNIINY